MGLKNIKIKMKTYNEVIDETVEYYSKNPRALNITDSGFVGCYYLHPNTGAMCAVGRCLNDEYLEKFGNSGSNIENLIYHNFVEEDFTVIFKEEYKYLSDADFWSQLQDLHDCDKYWSHNKLSVDGKRYVEVLKEEFK